MGEAPRPQHFQPRLFLNLCLLSPQQRFGTGSAFGMENPQSVSAAGHAANSELPLFVGHCKEWVREHTDVGVVPRMQIALEAHRHFRLGECATSAFI